MGGGERHSTPASWSCSSLRSLPQSVWSSFALVRPDTFRVSVCVCVCVCVCVVHVAFLLLLGFTGCGTQRLEVALSSRDWLIVGPKPFLG